MPALVSTVAAAAAAEHFAMAEAATCSVQQSPTAVTRRAVYSGEREAVVGQIAVPEQRCQRAARPQEDGDSVRCLKLFSVSPRGGG